MCPSGCRALVTWGWCYLPEHTRCALVGCYCIDSHMFFCCCVLLRWYTSNLDELTQFGLSLSLSLSLSVCVCVCVIFFFSCLCVLCSDCPGKQQTSKPNGREKDDDQRRAFSTMEQQLLKFKTGSNNVYEVCLLSHCRQRNVWAYGRGKLLFGLYFVLSVHTHLAHVRQVKQCASV